MHIFAEVEMCANEILWKNPQTINVNPGLELQGISSWGCTRLQSHPEGVASPWRPWGSSSLCERGEKLLRASGGETASVSAAAAPANSSAVIRWSRTDPKSAVSVVRVLMRNHHTHHLEAAIGGITVSLEEARNGVININKIYCSQVAKRRDYFYCKSE